MKKKSFQPVRNAIRFLILVVVFLVNILTVNSCYPDRLVIDRTATVLPPRPDTHFVARSDFKNYNSIEVNYSALSKSADTGVHLIGPNERALGTAKVKSSGKPVMISNKPVYPMKAVFQLDKLSDPSMIKVTLPNSASVPDGGNETFIIKIQ